MPLITQYFLPGGIGLGDQIRGALCLHNLAKKHNYTYQPNFRCGLIKDFVDLDNTGSATEVPENIERYFAHESGMNQSYHTMDQKMYSGEDINIITNVGSATSYPKQPLILNDSEKAFIKALLKPTAKLSDKIDKFASDNEIHKKTMYHIRCIDSLTESPTGLIKFLSTFNKFDDSFLFSNNQYIKDELQLSSGVKLATINSTHFKYTTSDNIIEDSMMEYFLVGMFKKITAYSMYEWTSSFISARAASYNVPITSNFLTKDNLGRWKIDNNAEGIRRIMIERMISI